jgi:hypothetical protein
LPGPAIAGKALRIQDTGASVVGVDHLIAAPFHEAYRAVLGNDHGNESRQGMTDAVGGAVARTDALGRFHLGFQGQRVQSAGHLLHGIEAARDLRAEPERFERLPAGYTTCPIYQGRGPVH